VYRVVQRENSQLIKFTRGPTSLNLAYMFFLSFTSISHYSRYVSNSASASTSTSTSIFLHTLRCINIAHCPHLTLATIDFTLHLCASPTLTTQEEDVSPAPQFMGTCTASLMSHFVTCLLISVVYIIALCSSINTTTFFSLYVRCCPVLDLTEEMAPSARLRTNYLSPMLRVSKLRRAADFKTA
jgi:hypothetical protein